MSRTAIPATSICTAIAALAQSTRGHTGFITSRRVQAASALLSSRLVCRRGSSCSFMPRTIAPPRGYPSASDPWTTPGGLSTRVKVVSRSNCAGRQVWKYARDSLLLECWRASQVEAIVASVYQGR